ncbi:MAG: HipA domain-containing protein [Gammaproteobacteria bacterium]|nr:HipA domain-containing protein [Gammaproteobacteria bacterium]MDA7961129.1 HipA domain-containing protein [Gammaproteobacteria bacterium]MDA7969514.1 HipA domain-containing protein [Gammaproteobacteria bacterium]MDA8031058.1 HipA domain-containing protein [Alphaproteobacteria bacterium]CAJ2375711.1 MAG: putative HipA_C domain-containing protein [Arenicellales bacterium IbO2]
MRFETINASEYVPVEPEEIGSKDKFWLQHVDSGQHCLFKIGRDQNENWAEVVCYRIAKLLGIPCAEYKLVKFADKHGVLSTSFLGNGEEFKSANKRLASEYSDYQHSVNMPPQYTIDRVFALLKRARPDVAPPSAFVCTGDGDIKFVDEIFVGYLMLDALVANQDRHHQNWGIITRVETKKVRLAPSFDHASSFSRESDEMKEQRMQTCDHGFTLEAFCGRAKSRFYDEKGEVRLKTLEVFQYAHQILPTAAKYWLTRLRKLDADADFRALFADADRAIITQISIDFALRMLQFNRHRLLDLDHA